MLYREENQAVVEEEEITSSLLSREQLLKYYDEKRSMGFSCHQMNKKAGKQMDTMAKINQFRDERNWRPHHNEKDLALSICLEAAELLELFQWKTAEEGIKQEERIKEELADVLIYSYMMADNLGFDLDEIIEEKLKKNAVKYPVPEK